MSLSSIASGILAAAISSISVLVVIYVWVAGKVRELQDSGDWSNNPTDIPEYCLIKFLGWSICLGAGASILSVIVLYRKSSIRMARNFDIDPTLITLSMILLILQVVSIAIGIKYFEREIV